MQTIIQEATATLFNAIEISTAIHRPWCAYVDLLCTSPKKSVSYYVEEEHDAIPGWKILHGLQQVLSYSTLLWQKSWSQIRKSLDQRSPVCLSVDDWVTCRYGTKAFGTGYFYSNAHKGVVWGNQLVDTVIKNGGFRCPLIFELHLKQDSNKVWERGLKQIQQIQTKLRNIGVQPKRIWTLGDCTYSNKEMAKELKKLGGFYLLGLAKDRNVELFGQSQRIDKYFATKPEKRLTVRGTGYRYKLSTANVKGWGRRRLLAIWNPRGYWRYFVSNKLRVTAKTLLLRYRDRWSVEDNHRDLKQFFGGEHFYVWSRKGVYGHFHLAYLTCVQAALERTKRLQTGVKSTMERLHREAIRWSRIN